MTRAAIQGLALPVLLIALWEALGRAEVVPQGILPTPGTILASWQMWAFGPQGMGLNPYSGTWAPTVWYSTRRVAMGFALAVAVGVPMGVLIGRSRLVARGVDPLI